MRYLVIRYLRKPNGQMDELVEATKRLRMRDHSYAAVILDFQQRRVEKAHLDGVTVPRDFDRIRDFYYQHYQKLIEQLEAANQPPTARSGTDPG
jgi:hypothetical protein